MTYGLLNLTHRDGHAAPEPLAPGEPCEINLKLNLIAHRFRAGSRIGLAISESLWPLVWPSPEIATLTFALGDASRLTTARCALWRPSRRPSQFPSATPRSVRAGSRAGPAR